MAENAAASANINAGIKHFFKKPVVKSA